MQKRPRGSAALRSSHRTALTADAPSRRASASRGRAPRPRRRFPRSREAKAAARERGPPLLASHCAHRGRAEPASLGVSREGAAPAAPLSAVARGKSGRAGARPSAPRFAPRSPRTCRAGEPRLLAGGHRARGAAFRGRAMQKRPRGSAALRSSLRTALAADVPSRRASASRGRAPRPRRRFPRSRNAKAAARERGPPLLASHRARRGRAEPASLGFSREGAAPAAPLSAVARCKSGRAGARPSVPRRALRPPRTCRARPGPPARRPRPGNLRPSPTCC
jgi:hypothetical protein